MWRLAFLCIFLSLGLCGCLTVLTRGVTVTPAAEAQYGYYDLDPDRLPTPQLFRFGFELSEP